MYSAPECSLTLGLREYFRNSSFAARISNGGIYIPSEELVELVNLFQLLVNFSKHYGLKGRDISFQDTGSFMVSLAIVTAKDCGA